jgi:hypothetical protein
MKKLMHLSLMILLAGTLAGCPLIEGNDETTEPQPATTSSTAPAQPTVSIHQAAAQGDNQAIRAHLYYGILLDERDQAGNTALHHAARAGHKDTAVLLAARGADVNAANDAGQTPLAMATDPDVRTYLIQMGAGN